MLIIDGHLDLAWNALQLNRNLQESVYLLRVQEMYTPGKGRAQNTVALPEMRKGRVALCFATLFARSTGQPVPHADYPSPIQAHAVAHGQLAYYEELERQGQIALVKESEGLNRHIQAWEAWEEAGAVAGQEPPLGFVISMEGADPIQSPDQLERWQQAGLRLLGLTHYGRGRYAGGTGVSDGLTDLGRQLLPEMERLQLILDLTHSSDASFWESLDLYNGPVLASHNNVRALVPHQRQFDDDQLQAIFQRDVVIGAAFDLWMLRPGWQVGVSTNEGSSIADVVQHIDYICQLAGNSRHAAIGTDLDGGFGREESPQDLDTIADLQRLPGLLADRGYSDVDIANILHGNWLRLLRTRWGD
jgi:membrane dipeptidase